MFFTIQLHIWTQISEKFYQIPLDETTKIVDYLYQ